MQLALSTVPLVVGIWTQGLSKVIFSPFTVGEPLGEELLTF